MIQLSGSTLEVDVKNYNYYKGKFEVESNMGLEMGIWGLDIIAVADKYTFVASGEWL